MKETEVKKVVQDMAALKQQIAMLEVMLKEKKSYMQKYFTATGEENYSTDHASVFVQTKTSIEYDIPKLQETVDKELLDEFLVKNYTVTDWKGMAKFLKQKGILGKEIKPFVTVEKHVDKEKLSKLYEEERISLADLEGCYKATVTKSVALRLKDGAAHETIPVEK